MREPNAVGVYAPEETIEVARHGRAFARAQLCLCEDGLWRYGLELQHGAGGFVFPIAKKFCAGRPALAAAKEAATADMLERLSPWASEPDSAPEELRGLRAAIERGFRQLSLF